MCHSSPIVEHRFDRSKPWAYFDGISQGDPYWEEQEASCILLNLVIKFKEGIGKGFKNKVELMEL